MKPFAMYATLLSLTVVTTAAVAFDLAYRGLRRFPGEPLTWVARGDPEQGRRQIIRYGCGACHVIPGVRHATGRVGPQLTGLRDQIYIAGVLTNQPPNLAEWIENPREINPRTAMPDLGVTPEEARHMAAYLYHMR